MLASNEGHANYQWLLHELVEPPAVVVPHHTKAQLAVAFRVLVDERADSELLRETLQLSPAGRALLQVDEVDVHAPFAEEAKCLADVGMFVGAKDLDVHAYRWQMADDGRQMAYGGDAGAIII